ncbi:serine/threonine-protein kinase 19 [Pelomyxa schiedti]|nr:serine/threonine-protein kinase 19 [Pelomyxa schiedti]
MASEQATPSKPKKARCDKPSPQKLVADKMLLSICSPKSPRSARPRVAAHEQREQQPSAATDENSHTVCVRVDDLNEEDFPSDIEVVLNILRNELPPAENDPTPRPPFCLRSQVYSLSKDRTAADKDLAVLVENNTIRIFNISVPSPDCAILLLDDYRRALQTSVESFKSHDQEEHPLSEGSSSSSTTMDKTCCSSPAVGNSRYCVFEQLLGCLETLKTCDTSFKELSEALSYNGFVLEDRDITLLMHAGVIVQLDVDIYRFSVPYAGPILSMIQNGRQELCDALSHTRFHEMLEERVLKKKLHMSGLGVQFHLWEMIGSNFIQRVATPSGYLLRLGTE